MSRNIFVFLLFVAINQSLFGQELSDTIVADSNSVIEVDQVQVIKAFEANLKTAERFDIKPTIEDVKIVDKNYNYKITIVPVDIEYPDPIIKPLAMKSDPEFPNKNTFIKLGYGSVKNPLLKILYSDRINDESELGVRLNYLAFDNSSNNKFQKMSHLDMGLRAKWYVGESSLLDVNINGELGQRGLYHMDSNDTIDYAEDVSVRDLSHFGFRTGIKMVDLFNAGIDFNAGVAAGYTKINLEDVSGINTGLELRASKRFSEATALTIGSELTYDSQKGIEDLNLFTSSARIAFKTRYAALKAKVGAQWVYDDNSKKGRFWPYTYISYALMDDHVQLFTGSSITNIRNNLRNLTLQNPYINANSNGLRSSVRSEYYLGVKGQFSFLGYEFKIGNAQLDRQFFFVNDDEDSRYFNIIHDDVTQKYLSGSLDIALHDNLGLGGKMSLSGYETDTLPEIINLPSLEMALHADFYFLDKKLKVHPSLFIADKSSFLTANNEVMGLNVLHELNGTVEYKLSEVFRVWLEVNNILDNQYERFQGYPMLGISGRVGLNLIF